MCQINFFDGYEMTIIAAVVLGGASISGDTGSVIGTFLGVLLMKLISNNLILLGIPAMVATLGASDIILGLAIGITDGSSIKELPSILNYVTNMSEMMSVESILNGVEDTLYIPLVGRIYATKKSSLNFSMMKRLYP